MTTVEPTLHQALAAVGWRSEPLPPGSISQGRFVFDETGESLGAMTAGEVWKMLRERGLVLP